jgi:hypothetical protein
MLTVVAFDTDQLSVVEFPSVIVDAAALKLPLAMTGVVLEPLLLLLPQPDIPTIVKAISNAAITR